MMLATMMASLPLMAAVPIVPTESVSTSQDAETSVVTVNYALSGAPGIVTIDIQTNAGGNAPPNYMVLDLATPTNACFYTEAEALPGGIGDVLQRLVLESVRLNSTGCGGLSSV